MLYMEFVLPRSLDVHIARIPIALPGRALWSPMGKDAELYVTEPIGGSVLFQRLPGGLKSGFLILRRCRCEPQRNRPVQTRPRLDPQIIASEFFTFASGEARSATV